MNRTQKNGLLYFYSTFLSIILTFLIFSSFFAVVIIKERIVKSSFDKVEHREIELTFLANSDEVDAVTTKEYGGATPNELFGNIDQNRSDEQSLENMDRSNDSKIVLNRSGDSIRMLRTKEHLSLEAPKVGARESRMNVLSGHNDDEIKDIYLASISSLLHSRWGNPRATDVGKAVVVRFWIYADGAVDYRLIRGSNDPLFDDRLDKLLKQIKADGVEKPDRKLELEIKFIVKE